MKKIDLSKESKDSHLNIELKSGDTKADVEGEVMGIRWSAPYGQHHESGRITENPIRPSLILKALRLCQLILPYHTQQAKKIHKCLNYFPLKSCL